MNDQHDFILDAYFWAYVDGGVEPEQTPLFSGLHEGSPLSETLATSLGMSLPDAEAALELARQEVAL